MRPMLFCTVVACLLMIINDAVAQQPLANRERRPERSVQSVGEPVGDVNGMKETATNLSGTTQDDALVNLLGATRAYRAEVDNWLKRHPDDPLPLVQTWKRFVVDPVKMTVQPEYGNQIAGLFAPSALAFQDSTFKPQVQLSYEMVFKDAFQWKNRFVQFVAFGFAVGTADQAFTGLTGIRNDLKLAFSVYAKLEVPLSEVWGSNRKKEADQDTEDKAQRELFNKQLLFLDQLERAIRQVHSVRQKQGEITHNQ